MAKFNNHHLPQQRVGAGRGGASPTKRLRGARNASQPLFDIRVDITLEHAIPTPYKDNFSLLPYSLIASVSHLFSLGPYSGISLVACVAEVKTPYSGSPRAEAELQAAVGGACIIADRLELIDKLGPFGRTQEMPDEAVFDETLLGITFPVITLVILGDTWYYQVVYHSARNACVRHLITCGSRDYNINRVTLELQVVLPPVFAGECSTHVGTFKLLKFVDTLRDWCLNVYCKDYTSILRALGNNVGWRAEDHSGSHS